MPVKVCLGGTFNVIHEGHIALLSRAFSEGDEIFVGLTSNAMAVAKRAVPVNDYLVRLTNLSETLGTLAGEKPFHIFRLDDEMGPAARENFDAIVVSAETLAGAKKINAARLSHGLKPLRIIKIDMVLGQDGKRISSTQILRKRK